MTTVDSADIFRPVKERFTKEFPTIAARCRRGDGIMVNRQESPFCESDATACSAGADACKDCRGKRRSGDCRKPILHAFGLYAAEETRFSRGVFRDRRPEVYGEITH